MQHQEMGAVGEQTGATTVSSWSFWFRFTYLPPAVLVGCEARMS